MFGSTLSKSFGLRKQIMGVKKSFFSRDKGRKSWGGVGGCDTPPNPKILGFRRAIEDFAGRQEEFYSRAATTQQVLQSC